MNIFFPRDRRHTENRLSFMPKFKGPWKRLNIRRLYTHQIEAIEHLERPAKTYWWPRKPPAEKPLSTPFRFWKKFFRNRDARALFLFPLKALEHDQLKNLSKWLERMESLTINAAIYDGDTTPHQRKKIRQNPAPHPLHQSRHVAPGHSVTPPELGEPVQEP